MKIHFQNEKQVISRIKMLTNDEKTISEFGREAILEKLNRMEARDERARKQLHKKDVELFAPIVTAILKQHKIIPEDV